MISVAFKLQNGIDHVFQNFWSSDGSVFGNMSNQENWNVCLFGKAQQVCRTLANLNHRAWRAFYTVCVEGLDGVDDEQLWLNGLGLHQNLLKVGFGE